MNPELRTEWVAALRSGEFMQGEGQLRYGDKYCCLGVLCELTARKGLSPVAIRLSGHSPDYSYDECTTMPSVRHDELTGLTQDDQEKLAGMNDDGHSFSEIAGWIETNL